MIDYRIIGPLEVSADGLVVDIGGHKLRALLAILLLRANEQFGIGKKVAATINPSAPLPPADRKGNRHARHRCHPAAAEGPSPAG